MSNLTQTSVSEGASTNRPLLNTPNPTQQVVMMAQSSSSIKPKVDYAERFPKAFMLSLSILQLMNSAAAITTQIVLLSTPFLFKFYGRATGIWCGVFYGLSGFLGVFASLRPSKPTIVAFMVTSIIASIVCLPGLILPFYDSEGRAYMEAWNFLFEKEGSEVRNYQKLELSGLGHAMIVIQIAITFVQAGVSIASWVTCMVTTCKAVSPPHQPMREDRTVNDTHDHIYDPVSDAPNMGMENQQNFLPQQQSGHVTIPMRQLQAAGASGASMTQATNPEVSVTGIVLSSASEPAAPPKYEKYY